MKKLFTIDIHTHILPKDIPNFNKRFGYGEFVQLKHHKPCCAKMMMNDQFFREVEANCWEPESRIQECDHQNVDVQVLSTVPVMFSYWTSPKDGLEISRSFHRKVLDCVKSLEEDGTWTHSDTDVSSESSEVQGIATAVWTTAIKNAKKAANEAAGV